MIVKYILLVFALLAITQGEFVSFDSTYENLPQTTGSFVSRICIFIETDTLTHDLGTIYLNLAETLSAAGHEVTVLLDEPLSESEKIYFSSSLEIQVVPELDVPHAFTPEQTWKAYSIYEFLKTQQFDVVHFPDWKGNAYYCVLAKHQGIPAFASTVFVVGAQAPFIWSKINNFERVKDTTALEIDYMQRMSIEHADVVISPSQFMLNWLKDNQWVLPAKSYVEQNIMVNPRLMVASEEDPHEDDKEIVAIKELVFYGDLKPSEGLVLFCDALDKLSKSEVEATVTFLGDSMDVQGIGARDYIRIRSRRWSFAYSIVEGKDRYESLRFLSTGSRLAVVAPERANSPLRIQELLWADVPFVASNVGGIKELIDVESIEEVLFSVRYDKLAEKMMNALKNGMKLAAFAKCPMMTKKQWVTFHSSLREVSEIKPLPMPLVSVCITHFNRPLYLRQAIASIQRQTYQNIEIILVDDASDKPEAVNAIDELRPVFEAKGWKIVVMKENSYLGKARNMAVNEASGEYVLFLDDDNVAKPNEVEVFVRAALNGGADLLTSAQDFFTGSEVPTDQMKPTQRRVPLGGDVATGFFWNCFGDANSFVKKSSFMKLGGFTEDYQVGYEDYEFFAKAVLKGFTLEVVPEPLFWYRRAFDTMSFSTPLFKNRMRYLRPYMENLSPGMSNLFLYVQSMHYDNEEPFMGEAANCSKHLGCDECKNEPQCGWCEATRECQLGRKNGSFANCSLEQGWSFENDTACVTCSGDCGSCTDNKLCGYCKAGKTENCEIAGKEGAIYVHSSCYNSTEDWITHELGSCKKSSKTKLIIIVVCSVGGGLLLFAAAALLAFFIYQRRQQQGQEYSPINFNQQVQ